MSTLWLGARERGLQLSTDKRFDQQILDQATAACKDLAAHKEIKSVAVIIDWDMPSAAADALPSGVWQPSPTSVAPVEAGMSMQIQMARMAHILGRNVLKDFERMYKSLVSQQKDKKDVSG